MASVRDCSLACLARTLTHLDLGGCGLVTDSGVRRLTASCPALASLSLSRWILVSRPRYLHTYLHIYTHLSRTKISDRSLFTLSSSRCRNTLREIRVNGCVNITDSGIEVFSISSLCPST